MSFDKLSSGPSEAAEELSDDPRIREDQMRARRLVETAKIDPLALSSVMGAQLNALGSTQAERQQIIAKGVTERYQKWHDRIPVEDLENKFTELTFDRPKDRSTVQAIHNRIVSEKGYLSKDGRVPMLPIMKDIDDLTILQQHLSSETAEYKYADRLKGILREMQKGDRYGDIDPESYVVGSKMYAPKSGERTRFEDVSKHTLGLILGGVALFSGIISLRKLQNGETPVPLYGLAAAYLSYRLLKTPGEPISFLTKAPFQQYSKQYEIRGESGLELVKTLKSDNAQKLVSNLVPPAKKTKNEFITELGADATTTKKLSEMKEEDIVNLAGLLRRGVRTPEDQKLLESYVKHDLGNQMKNLPV